MGKQCWSHSVRVRQLGAQCFTNTSSSFGMCIGIMEIWLGIANGQILSIFDSNLPVTCPYFYFRMITSVNMNGCSSNLVCALILWRSAFGLLMSKFCHMSILLFLDDKFSKYQWIFTKRSVCINIMEIAFGIANG